MRPLNSIQQPWPNVMAMKAAERAELLLRCLGGGSIVLRISTGLAEDDARGLGMTAMSYEDIEISPVLISTRSDGTKVAQVAASSLSTVADARATSVNDMLACAVALVKDDVAISIAKIEPQYIGLVEYMYNLVLSE